MYTALGQVALFIALGVSMVLAVPSYILLTSKSARDKVVGWFKRGKHDSVKPQ